MNIFDDQMGQVRYLRRFIQMVTKLSSAAITPGSAWAVVRLSKLSGIGRDK